MTDPLYEKARRLYRTIQHLKTRTLSTNAAKNVGMECAAKELTLPQWSTLAVIRESGAMSIKEIAERTNVSAPSASAMVDRLVEFGVVTREPSRVDRREVRVALSPEGAKAVDEMETQLLQSLVEIMEKLGPHYTDQWCDVYARIQAILDGEEAERRDGEPPDTDRSFGV